MSESNINLYGFSSRHIRLKYQAVVAAVGVCLLAFLEVENLKVPGFIEFKDVPPLWSLEVGLIVFAVFSIVAFYSQTQIERKHIPHTILLFKNEIERQKDKLLPKVASLTGDNFDRFQSAIIPEISNYSKEIAKGEDFALKWQPTSKHFYEMQTEVEFAIIQMKSYQEQVRKEIYQSNHNFDTHYLSSLESFQQYIKELIDLMWRPHDFIAEKGRLDFASRIASDLKLLNHLAIAIPRKSETLLKDLKEHLSLQKFNHVVLSVAIPFGFSVGATTLGAVVIAKKYFELVTCQ